MEQGIKIKTTKRGGLYTSFVVTGHAMSAPHGQDIVCAAVSVLTQTTLISLKRLIAGSFGVDNGLVYCNFNDDRKDPDKSKAVQVLMNNMMLGLRLVNETYPGYLTFEEEVIST